MELDSGPATLSEHLGTLLSPKRKELDAVICFVNMEKYCGLYQPCIHGLKNRSWALTVCVNGDRVFGSERQVNVYNGRDLRKFWIHPTRNASLMNGVQ